MNAISQIAISSNGAADAANAINSAVLVLIVAAISYAMMRVDGAELFASPAANVASEAVAAQDGAADQKLVGALMRLMADERIYRHDNVSIGTLATKLSIPEYKLRRLINQRLGYRNFNVFLNEHRIAEAKGICVVEAVGGLPAFALVGHSNDGFARVACDAREDEWLAFRSISELPSHAA